LWSLVVEEGVVITAAAEVLEDLELAADFQ
jgi:hypothetical protein